MGYEEKYKEAIESIKRIYSQADSYGKELMEKEFPELKESEDEKIRRELIEFIRTLPCTISVKNEYFAWLEKQGEKKDTITPQWMVDFLKEHRRHFATPMDYDEKKETDGKLLAVIKWLEGNPQLEQKTAWSEEDEKILKRIDNLLYSLCQIHGSEYEKLHNWLKSLKDRVQPQPKQEWSEYDKIQLSEAIQMIEANGTWIRSEDTVKKVSNWLKSLKPQNRWKPSEEQMKALNWVAYNYALMDKGTEENLQSLYNSLKKL